MESEHLKVGIRIRPYSKTENQEETPLTIENVTLIQETSIKLIDGDHFVSTKFDIIFPDTSTQDNIFSFVSPAIDQIIKGFNCTIFAYGQTGSGKTYTMFGEGWESNNPAPQVYYNNKHKQPNEFEYHPLDNIKGHGVIPKSISSVFNSIEKSNFTIYTSFLQIYNEKIFDLLQENPKIKPLAIRENKIYGIFVEGLAEYIVETESDCFILLAKGDANRIVRQTKLNHHSSRSHTIFQIQIETDKANKRGVLKKGKINFCDLAGSEKYDKENNMTSAHIKEMTQINKSLTVLGKVIHELGRKKSPHVPYRDSKLTRLLQDSLGLSTRTILIATISPSYSCVEETISTLKFADRAKQILVKAKKNEISALNNNLVVKLQREIQHLKGLLKLKKNGGIQELQQQLIDLKEENKKLKLINSNITVEEVEKLKQENKRLRIELQSIGHVKESGDVDYNDEGSVSSSQFNLNLTGGSPRPTGLTEGVCPICYNPVPCSHYNNPADLPRTCASPTFSQADSQTQKLIKPILSTLDFHKKLNVRYKMKNNLIQNNEIIEEIKANQNSMKELRLVRSRFERIAQMEKLNKKILKEELEKLEENKKKDELRKKSTFKKPQIESLQELYVKKKEKLLNKLKTNLD
jgi:Kinesin motor domain